MKKIKISFCLLLIIALSSCRQNDEEITLVQGATNISSMKQGKQSDSTVVSKDSAVTAPKSFYELDEDPKFPPRQ